MKVLIAEDDPISSLVLNKTLTKWCHEVVVRIESIGEVLPGRRAP